jgi:DNA-binding protein H-NS
MAEAAPPPNSTNTDLNYNIRNYLLNTIEWVKTEINTLIKMKEILLEKEQTTDIFDEINKIQEKVNALNNIYNNTNSSINLFGDNTNPASHKGGKNRRGKTKKQKRKNKKTKTTKK